MDRDAVETAVEVARAHGLRVDDPRPLPGHSNVLVHLAPAPVVARVATTTGIVRRGDRWLDREVRVGAHLAGLGAPVVAPSAEIDPGPHEAGGLVLSFWDYVEELPEPADASAAGRALRTCHDALASYPGELPAMAAWAEVRTVLAQLAARGIEIADVSARVDEIDRRLVAAAPALRPVHGDAHLANVLHAVSGPRWIDWEDCFAGPLEWDLACLVKTGRLTGRGGERAEAALAAHEGGYDDDLLSLMIDARAVQSDAWGRLIRAV